MRSFTKWHLWRKSPIPFIQNRRFVPLTVFYTQFAVGRPHLALFYIQSVKLSPRFIPQSVFYTQSVYTDRLGERANRRIHNFIPPLCYLAINTSRNTDMISNIHFTLHNEDALCCIFLWILKRFTEPCHKARKRYCKMIFHGRKRKYCYYKA